MKNRKFSGMAMMLIFVLTLTSAFAGNPPDNAISIKGQSNTWLGAYQITELSPVTITGKLMRTFELAYEKAEKKVMIYIDETSECQDYIVRSKNLEVKYVCSKKGFGVKLLNGKLRVYDPRVNDVFLSREEFNNQARISDGNLETSAALGLIASYYPALMKSTNLLD